MQSLDTFKDLVQLFIELRGQGMSLSSVDLLIIDNWSAKRHEPQFLAETMLEVAAELQENQKSFPANLTMIDRRVTRILKRRAES